MTVHQAVIPPSDVRTWIHDGRQMPAWVREEMEGDLNSNGTFLVRSAVGAARVHPGHVVIKHDSGVWVRTPEEVAGLVEGFRACGAAHLPVGPGKVAQFGSSRKTKPRRGEERKLAYRPPVGTRPSIEWMFVADLSVDASYQRSIDNDSSRRLIASIAANFDWRLCAPLVVSRRNDGSKIIIDGQHRWAAAQRRKDIDQLPCCLFSYDSPEDEARMFILANRARKPMNRLDDFHAALAAADEDALEIRDLVTQAGLSIARKMAIATLEPGQVMFTSSISQALRRYGAPVVSAALTTIAECFRGQVLSNGSAIFGGLVKVFANPPQGFDPDDLYHALGMLDAAGWGDFVTDQSGTEARAIAMRTAIIEAINSLERVEAAE